MSEEIKGDDTAVLQSVLEADKEREWLLKVEEESGRRGALGGVGRVELVEEEK